MTAMIAQGLGSLIRWGIYLILIGEIGRCTIDLKQKAQVSVTTGLIKLKALNSSLHKSKAL